MKFDQAIQGLRHGPEKMARACRLAADSARRNPYFTPDEGEVRAQEYEAQAREWDAVARDVKGVA